ncbi:MAG: thioredoxin family protein [Planctomycetes bacterium]|nr:thioredoxin family protein [Planctomycetota bacterium]
MLISLVACSRTWAQDEGGDILKVGQVNFWGSPRPVSKARSNDPAPRDAVSTWAEPIRMPDGRYGVYVPPPQVLQFLEDPTPDRARAYIRWQQERVAKLRRAMELLEAVAGDAQSTPGSPKPVPPVAAKADEEQSSSTPIEVLYFKQAGCKFCDLQETVLAEARKKWPRVRIRDVVKGENDELWTKFGVRVTPTLVFHPGAKAPVMTRGLAPADQIESILRKLANEK